MGWLFYKPTYFKANGKVDRKAQMDVLYEREWPRLQLVKSVMKGNMYYAAIMVLKEEKVVNGKKVLVDVPEEERKIYGESYQTDVDPCSGDFGEKPIGDAYGFPDSILKLLNTLSDEDRKRVAEYKDDEKRKRQLSKMPVGSKIQIVCDSFYRGKEGEDKPGDILTLVKKYVRTKYARGTVLRWVNLKQNYYIKQNEIPVDYVVIS